MSKWQLPPDPRGHHGLTAYEREKRAAVPYARQNHLDGGQVEGKGKTEFDVLKENHR
jgi:hypothetical protein